MNLWIGGFNTVNNINEDIVDTGSTYDMDPYMDTYQILTPSFTSELYWYIFYATILWVLLSFIPVACIWIAYNISSIGAYFK